MRIIYLHGFASSPTSRKARLFAPRLEAAGFQVEVPQLDAGDFSSLTITGQMDIVERAVNHEPVILVGSSMGGYLAALYAARHPEVERLVLFAPAFDFHDRWPKLIGEQAFAQWQRTGWLEVYHYALGAPAQVGWQLAEDALRWEPEPDFHQPALIFHGRRDEVVLPETSRAFAESHPNVQLHEFDAGHELNEVLEEMWSLTAKFLGIARE